MKKIKENLVSIIVPVFNAENFIKETIKTVLEQTYENWELILVNDGSLDGSKKIIDAFAQKESKIKIINLDQNQGAANARNVGIEHAKGKYIAFLDADDLWNKKKLEKQINLMEEKGYAFSYTGYEFTNKEGKPSGKIVNVPYKMTYKEALKNTTIFTSTVILDVEKLGKELIKMPNVKRGQDTATWWKILKRGNIAYGLNENLSLYRRSPNTLSANKIKALKRTWKLYRQVENLSLVYSLYNFVIYIWYAIKRRV